MLAVGDLVRVREPFTVALPGVYVIEGQNPETGAWQIAGGIDVAAEHLERVEPGAP